MSNAKKKKKIHHSNQPVECFEESHKKKKEIQINNHKKRLINSDEIANRT